MDAVSDNLGGSQANRAQGSENLRPGQKLGRYTLLLPVAQGGMARVWAARQLGTRGFQRIVAIKTIMPALAADPEFERMFLDEARIASSIHHPNVCEILDLGEEGSVLFLAMEWVDGISMLSLFKSKEKSALPDAVAARIIADACAGLHAAHDLRDENGQLVHVVHRDVSPHNILISYEGNVKVADFGVAKAMGLEHAPTMAGQLKGKVAYMSPEQAVGDTSVDRRSDVFSLGACLYEAVTGHRAWAGANDVARLQNLLAGNIIPPRQVRPDLPQDLETILAYSLALDPSRRYQSAEQMRLALEQFLMARKALVTAGDIAAVVRSLCGREIEDRKARIRQASTAIQGDFPAAPTSNSLGAVTYQGSTKKSLRRSTATAISLVSGGITIMGLMMIVGLQAVPSQPAADTPTAAASAPPPPLAPEPVASAAEPTLSETIVIKPTPTTAIVEVNGTIMGTGEVRFSRPARGKPLQVVVRAQGHSPATVAIDHDSDAEWSIELGPEPVADAAPAEVVEAPPPTAAPAGPQPTKTTTGASTWTPPPPTAAKKKGKPPAIPDNPF